MWRPDNYLKRLYEDTKPQYMFDAADKMQWSSWRETLKKRIIADLGRFPEQPVALEPIVVEQVNCGEYVRERVVIRTYEHLEMPVYVLRPVGAAARRPAVIACHGHGYGSKEIVGLMPDGVTILSEPTYQNCFAVTLVKKGFVVFAPELLGFGDRMLERDVRANNDNSCHTISTYLLQMGQTMAGYRVYETKRVIDYAAGHPLVDAQRIGCMGISGGGLVAGFVSAVDERIRATVISGYVNTFKDSILGVRHCIDNYVPGLNRHAEMPDIISLIAPRALLVESGSADWMFPIEATKQACLQIERVYRLLNKMEEFSLDLFEGDHRLHGKTAYRWMQTKLSSINSDRPEA